MDAQQAGVRVPLFRPSDKDKKLIRQKIRSLDREIAIVEGTFVQAECNIRMLCDLLKSPHCDRWQKILKQRRAKRSGLDRKRKQLRLKLKGYQRL